MSDIKLNLPVPVLEAPHWRINIRPTKYLKEKIPSLTECFNIIKKTKLSIRGWDYPSLSPSSDENGQGNNWIASWSKFMGIIEYWRFYQSGQFLHLFALRENIDTGFKKILRENSEARILTEKDFDWDKIPGFISILDFVYSVTEIFEFATRLCEANIYDESLMIDIELKNIKNFILANADPNRAWFRFYKTTESDLKNSWIFKSEQLLARSQEETLNTIIWFFDRFGWRDPPKEIINKDIKNFLNR